MNNSLLHRVPGARLALLWLLILGAGVATARAQQRAVSPLPPPSGYVNDFANVIDPATKQRMETILVNLKTRADIEFAVVTVRTTGGRDIFDYSLAVARGWGIGAREGEKNGLLLLAAIDDRKYYVQVSRHIEGDLPDGYVGAIGRQMRDPFRANRYGEGLMGAVQTLVATLGQKRNFSIEGIDQSYALRDAQTSGGNTQGPPRAGLSTCAIVFIIFIILLVILASRRGGGGGGGGNGCLNLLLLNALLNSGNSSSGGWGGSGGGGWSSGGGGGGGFGGFGGGGDFGGGGAGGDW